jgi:hypothetical protein
MVAIPQGVRDVVGRRLGRLSVQVNRVLSVAAVLGRDFDVELLAALREASEDSLLDALDEAVQAGLVQETGADRYRFAHVLVRTTLLEELSATRRRRLHRRVDDALEKLRPEDVVALAYHFGQAGPDGDGMSRAVRYGLAAAEQALQARALGDAEARFHQVLELLDDPATLAAPERIAALCGLGEAQRDQGNAESRTTLLEAGRRAQAAADVPMLVRAALANSRGLPSVIGAVDTDRVAITEAALESLGPQPTPERARLLAHLAAELCFAGDDQRRVALSDEAEGIARGLGDNDLLAWVLNRTGYAAVAPDRVERLVARGEEATRLSDAAGDPAATTGDLDESVALFEESDRVLAGFGCHGLLPFVRLTHAEVLRRRGSDNDRMQAMQLLDQVRQGATAIQAPNLVGQADELAAFTISTGR